MRPLNTLLLTGLLSFALFVQADPVRYMATMAQGSVVEFSKDKETITVRLSDDSLMTYKILHYTTHSHKPTTFSDSRGLKIHYSTLAAVGYIHEARMSLSGDVVTHLTVVRLQPE